MNNISKLVGAAFAVLIMTVVNPALADGVKAWSESEVLAISDELSTAARKLRVECRNSPPTYFEETSGGHLEFRYHVRHFLGVSYRLNNALEDGAGREETKPIYDTLAGMKEGLNHYANKPGGAWIAVQHAVENVDKYLTQLDTYYVGG
jgi:hypothetical protein